MSASPTAATVDKDVRVKQILEEEMAVWYQSATGLAQKQRTNPNCDNNKVEKYSETGRKIHTSSNLMGLLESPRERTNQLVYSPTRNSKTITFESAKAVKIR